MSKLNFVLLLIIVICVCLTIVWAFDTFSDKGWEKTNHLLTWYDFRGIPDLWLIATGSGAVIKADLKHETFYELEIAQGSCHYSLTKVEGIAYMSRIESWANPIMKSFYTLQHEQIHFDIAEVHAEIFNQRVENELLNRVFLCPVGSDSWFQSKIKMEANAQATAILNQIREQMWFMQEVYDVQTNHGENYAQQKAWENRISELLD
jgi:hypothetical protein